MPKGRLQSVMQQHNFAKVPEANIQRSSFKRDHGYKTTFDVGDLIPVYVDEALPGDTFNLKMHAFTRLATPIFPIMDNIFMESFFFAVPIRLVWSNFQKMMGEQEDPGDSIDFTVPQVVSTYTANSDHGEGSLYDYLGLPTKVDGYTHSALQTRAYHLIWNEWFRDENLQDSVTVDKGDGPDTAVTYNTVLKRNKRFDYFTSCLPWPQKGTALELPVDATTIDVDYDNENVAAVLRNRTTGALLSTEEGLETSSGGVFRTDSNIDAHYDPNGTLQVTVPSSIGGTINELRQAFQIQKLLERDARGGTRYTEVIRSHFGVTSPDSRLQRPEYLGGGSTYININPVAQTGETNTTPQGNLAAFGTGQLNNHGFTKSFTEHCILIGLVSARADLTYQQKMDRMWSRSTRYDFYWPALSHIGEQAVLRKEILVDGTSSDDDVFGYNERYAEYRYKPSSITGQFRSNATTSLDSWHLSEDNSGGVTLNSAFIQVDPPIDRVIATPTEPHFLFDAFFDLQTARPMPIRSVPGLVDHF